ncbi:hypothetical protein BC938DRAFT_471876, partial [Jimgerdemannia flammicorona]
MVSSQPTKAANLTFRQPCFSSQLWTRQLDSEQWDAVMKEIMRVTKPGGWVELIECDVIPHSTGPMTSAFFAR